MGGKGDSEMPLKSVVLFIACGTLIFFIIFIFAKRSISRFTLKSHRAPHTAIGSGAPSALRSEISRRLRRVAEICVEPKLISEETFEALRDDGTLQCLYRMKAVDSLKVLDDELSRHSPSIYRDPTNTLRAFLLELKGSGPLSGLDISVIEKLSESYNHARHDPSEFGESHCQQMLELLNKVIRHTNEQRSQQKLSTFGKRDLKVAYNPTMIDFETESDSATVKRLSRVINDETHI